MAIYHNLRLTKLSQVLQSESCSQSLSHTTLILHIDKLGCIFAFTRNSNQIAIKLGNTVLAYPSFMLLLGFYINIWP